VQNLVVLTGRWEFRTDRLQRTVGP